MRMFHYYALCSALVVPALLASAWLGIAVSHYRFRKGYLTQGGRLQDLPYRAKLFPFGPLFAFALCLVITLGQELPYPLRLRIVVTGPIRLSLIHDI